MKNKKPLGEILIRLNAALVKHVIVLTLFDNSAAILVMLVVKTIIVLLVPRRNSIILLFFLYFTMVCDFVKKEIKSFVMHLFAVRWLWVRCRKIKFGKSL